MYLNVKKQANILEVWWYSCSQSYPQTLEGICHRFFAIFLRKESALENMYRVRKYHLEHYLPELVQW